MEELKDIASQLDNELEKWLQSHEGEKIKRIRMILQEEYFVFDPTKRKLIEILEHKLNEKINEQYLGNAKVNKVMDEDNEKMYSLSDLAKESLLTFVIGLVAGCMLYQLGTELLR